MLYNVAEIFTSVQGEGDHLGRRVTFIRLGGCNLDCPWCDSKETWSSAEAKAMTVDEIIDSVDAYHVIITGGEPTIQDLVPLAIGLKDIDCFIGIETNGTNDFSTELRSLIDWIACSPKPPQFRLPNYFDEIKLVISNELTENDVERIIHEVSIANPAISIWLQPEYFDFLKSVERALEYVNRFYGLLRLGIQAHKYWEVE